MAESIQEGASASGSVVVLLRLQLDVADLGVYRAHHQKSLLFQVGQKYYIVRAGIELTESVAFSPVLGGDRDCSGQNYFGIALTCRPATSAHMESRGDSRNADVLAKPRSSCSCA